MTMDDPVDEREALSRMEAIAYIECMLPEFVTLAASQPDLQLLLAMAHLEAKRALARLSGSPFGEQTEPSGDGPA